MRPEIRVVDKGQIDSILDQALEILEKMGFEIQGAALRQRVLEAGLVVGADGRVRFPRPMVEKAIAAAPTSFSLFNRDGGVHTEIGGDKVHFVPGSSALRVLDAQTGVTREAITADFVDYVRLAHGLPHIAYLATAFSTGDVPLEVADAWRLYLCMSQSPKPVVTGAFTAHGVPRMAEMMTLFRRDWADLRLRPFSIFTITATGNFRYSEDSCQNLLDCAAWGIPMEFTPVTLMGLIAPVTVLEAAVFHTADVLAGITMTQLLRPGNPVLFGGAPAAFHMGEATSPMAAIEAQRLNMVYAAVGKYLGLPTQAYMALSDSKALDAQAGAESFSTGLLAALAGINSVSGPGMLDYVLVFSLAKLVLDNELCGQALHFVRDLRPADGARAIDLARELIADGHLLAAEHTLQHWPAQLHLPNKVIDRAGRDKWEREGRPDLMKRATAEVRKGLAAFNVPQLDEHLNRELIKIIRSGMMNELRLPEIPALPVVKERRGNVKRGRPRKREDV